MVQTLALGGNALTDVIREGSMLYTMDSAKTLRTVDISEFEMELRGFLILPNGAGKLFVGNGIAYATAQDSFRGGFATANVTDPDNITLISGSDVGIPNVAPKAAIAANGSG